MSILDIFKRDPIRSLERKFQKTYAQAKALLRMGDLRGYKMKVNEADTISEKIDELSRQVR